MSYNLFKFRVSLDNDYGLYDVVAGKFYTHPDLTGD